MLMNCRLVLIILGMLLSSSVAGTISITGTIAPYLLSYYYDKDESIKLSTILSSSFISVGIQNSSFYIASLLSRKYPEILLMIIPLSVCSISLFFLSYTENAYCFIIVYGIIMGLYGAFMCYPAVWIGTRSMPEEMRGVGIGIGLSSYGIAPFIYGFIFTCLINPENKPPTRTISYGDEKLKLFDESVYSRLPMTIRILSIIFFVVGVISITLIYDKRHNTLRSTYTLTLKQLLSKYNFWYLFVLMTLRMLIFMFGINVYKSVGLLYISDDFYLAYVGGAGFIMSALFRVIVGKLFDRYPWHYVSFVVASIELVLILIYYYSLPYKSSYSVVTILLLGVSGGSYLSMWILSDKVFKEDKWAFSIISLGGIVSIFTIVIMTGTIIPLIGYEYTFALIAGLQMASLILIANVPMLFESQLSKSSLYQSYFLSTISKCPDL